MLKIINDRGQILELQSNTQFTMERNNSLFTSESEFAHDIAYPGTTGLTENNKLFIRSGHLTEALNTDYEFPVQVMISDYTFYKAVFTYKVVKDQLQFILKVNFGAVAAKMKIAMLPDIYTADAVNIGTTAAAMEAHMKDTCFNPQNYPYAFFPVNNPSWDEFATSFTQPWINEWDHAAQKFIIRYQATSMISGLTPFFKLTYVLKRVFEYLKFNVVGGIFDDPDSQQIYLYNRRALSGFAIGPSMYYLPQINIADLIKMLTDRLKISFDFDLLSSTVIVETPGSILTSSACIDISEFVGSVDEKATPEGKGYKITLKIDEADQAQNRGTGDENDFTPATGLIIGDGENKLEVDIGTLAKKDETDYSYPITDQSCRTTEPITEWPLRLLRFSGMKVVPGFKVFPQASPMDLDGSDARWYCFLNDAKKLTITASIPPSILLNMKPSTKIGFIDKGVYFYALPEKITFPIINTTTERMSVKIQARTIVSSFNTKYYIADLIPQDTETGFSDRYKAYWIPEIHGFNEIRVERVPINGSTATFTYTPIDSPTDDGGIGGTVGKVIALSGSRIEREKSEARLFCPVKPQYYIIGGYKRTFTQVSNYYTFDDAAAMFFIYKDKPIWIVF
nr:hypothetical protein [Pedobacter sp. ASV19]